MNNCALRFSPLVAPLGLYPVVDSCLWIERLLSAGVTTLQLRIKGPAAPNLRAQITHAVALGQSYQAQVFINDHWQLALEQQAYGVHLGQEDLGQADLVAIQQAGLRLGISTHNPAELQRALAYRPSYVALGHIYPTATKQMPSSPQGLAALRHQLPLTSECPAVAIGGIGLQRVPEVLATGVTSIAVVSAITQATDWRAATKQLLALVEGQR